MSRMSESAKLRRERRQREGWPVDRRVGSLNHGLRYMQVLGGWALPLPTIDPQIVRRSAAALDRYGPDFRRSEEHPSELQSLMRTSYAVFRLTKKKNKKAIHIQ